MTRRRKALGAAARDSAFRNPTDELIGRSTREELLEIPPEDLVRAAWQTRQSLDPEALQQLVVSVQTHGVLEPLLARRDGEGALILLAGHRRREAAVMAGLARVPVRVLDVDGPRAQAITLAENLARADLSPWDEVRGLAALRTALEQAGERATRDRIAALTGKSTGSISTALRIAERLAPTLASLDESDRQGLTELPKTALHNASRAPEPSARLRILKAGLAALGTKGDAPGRATERALKRRSGPDARPYSIADRLSSSGRFSFRLRCPPESMEPDAARELLGRLEDVLEQLRRRAAS